MGGRVDRRTHRPVWFERCPGRGEIPAPGERDAIAGGICKVSRCLRTRETEAEEEDACRGVHYCVRGVPRYPNGAALEFTQLQGVVMPSQV